MFFLTHFPELVRRYFVALDKTAFHCTGLTLGDEPHTLANQVQGCILLVYGEKGFVARLGFFPELCIDF